MIVDLVRNDLSRVCVPDVGARPGLFDVETYAHRAPTRLDDRAAPSAGRVGGRLHARGLPRRIDDRRARRCAPWRSSTSSRTARAGCTPVRSGTSRSTGTADFSIVIRTLVATADEVTFGAGGAIVALSDPEEEYEETMVKAVTMQRCLSMTGDRTPRSGPGS